MCFGFWCQWRLFRKQPFGLIMQTTEIVARHLLSLQVLLSHWCSRMLTWPSAARHWHDSCCLAGGTDEESQCCQHRQREMSRPHTFITASTKTERSRKQQFHRRSKAHPKGWSVMYSPSYCTAKQVQPNHLKWCRDYYTSSYRKHFSGRSIVLKNIVEHRSINPASSFLKV